MCKDKLEEFLPAIIKSKQKTGGRKLMKMSSYPKPESVWSKLQAHWAPLEHVPQWVKHKFKKFTGILNAGLSKV